jgi:hypothetical protein
MSACGSTMDASAFAGNDDGGGEGGTDSGELDGVAGFDGGAPRPPALVVAHASPDLYDFRMCFARSSSPSGTFPNMIPRPAWPDDTAGPMPLANYPGVPAGGGVPLPTLGRFVPGSYLVPYVVRAKVLERSNLSAATCDQLICTGGQCLDKQDYAALTPIDGTSLVDGGAYLLAIVGCLPLNASAGASCGAGYSMTLGNLHATVMRLDEHRPALADAPIALQIAHAAEGLGPITVNVDTLDASAPRLSYGEVAPSAAVTLSRPALADYGKIEFTLHVASPSSDAGDAGDAGTLALSLAAIERATAPGKLPTSFYQQDSNFVFVVLGDPSPAVAQITTPDGGVNPAYDGHGLHVIAIPTASLDLRDGGAL